MLFSASYALLWAVVIAQALVIFVLARQLTFMREIAGSSSTKQVHLPLGSRAPDFKGLDARDGRTLTSSDLRGRRVVLCFLSAGCGICRTIARELSRLSPEELTSLIVYCNGPREYCKEYLRMLPSAVCVIDTTDDLAEKFGATAFPVLVIVDDAWLVAGYRYPMRGGEVIDAVLGATQGDPIPAVAAGIDLLPTWSLSARIAGCSADF